METLHVHVHVCAASVIFIETASICWKLLSNWPVGSEVRMLYSLPFFYGQLQSSQRGKHVNAWGKL